MFGSDVPRAMLREEDDACIRTARNGKVRTDVALFVGKTSLVANKGSLLTSKVLHM